ncbi:GNAT family N-acetyltransferase [Sporosarcina sp. P13]|uniref:GNAT family N-acetyltransferase n=1 Tax=Sporosarcina sp. P13 TaxID=2048263 RepID=UPI000C16385C|nr:GNAT family N-acetyltransferase [Sporosarcina sp. P13]PIC62651.1 GNAT family N-acetyltransferase [Sporosarcina sp. P13]
MSTLRQTVKLEKYKPEFLKALKEFELPTEKAQYTAFPAVILEKLTDDQYPIVILSNDEPVGFFLLQSTDRVKEFTDNPRALLLTALSIDNSKQGKGFAKEAMNLIKQFVNQEFSEYDEIILAVNHKNIPAQNLYKRVGFSDTGKRKIGKIGEQFIFNTFI